MAAFTIFGASLTAGEIMAMKELIEQAGGALDGIEVVTAIGDPDPEAENDVILFMGTSAVCTDPYLELAFIKAANGPRRAIWIWPSGGATAELPSGAAKYAYSCVPWSAEKLMAVVADDDITCFETAEGTPIPKVPTERNICVEEEELAE